MAKWEIEPYHNNDADICDIDGDNEARQYAMDRLDEIFTNAEPGELYTLTVKMQEDAPAENQGNGEHVLTTAAATQFTAEPEPHLGPREP